MIKYIGGLLNMRAVVNKDECISCGLCPSLCPEVFEFEDDGKAGVKVDGIEKEVLDSAREAEENCPTNAISILE